MAHTLIIADAKRRIIEFDAETIEFEREEGSLLLSAHGETTYQDSPALEELNASARPAHITLLKGAETVLDAPFRVTFFTFEPDTLIIALS